MERAQRFSVRLNCSAVQQQLNLFEDNPAMLQLCEEANLASLCRGPLVMGFFNQS
ncbi:hypothetical protein GCM10008938_43190 [Deinococcus roseus]|uniref:Uncharacterized protein n=1 Tax=Deinococcus roseus TaxID=392414 RepID=A0ABQ2DC11_9DEIO|nr:hypothetical protein GCM10008938_43190 [Deinococcus roseus]